MLREGAFENLIGAMSFPWILPIYTIPWASRVPVTRNDCLYAQIQTCLIAGLSHSKVTFLLRPLMIPCSHGTPTHTHMSLSPGGCALLSEVLIASLTVQHLVGIFLERPCSAGERPRLAGVCASQSCSFFPIPSSNSYMPFLCVRLKPSHRAGL